jgi:hypothetical protein
VSNGNGREVKLFAVVLLAALLLVALLVLYLVPAAAPLLANLDSGMGLKESTLWGFGVTVALFVLFALVAGDSLIGEIQFILGSFFGFFLILTLLIAWVF